MDRSTPCQVSVIIPCYNQAPYLARSIESVRAQSLNSWEIIVIDDGSTDDSALIATSFGETLRYIYQVNAGPSAARNAGIRHARAPWIAFLDSDDWWHPAFLSTLLRSLDHCTRPALAYCRQVAVAHDESRLLPAVYNRRIKGDPLLALIGDQYLTADAVMVSRSLLLDVGGFDEQLHGHEEWDLWLRLAEKKIPFIHVPEVLAFYRQHPSGIHLSTQRMDTSRLAVLRKWAAYGNRSFRRTHRAAWAKASMISAVNTVVRGDLDGGIKDIQEVFRTMPESSLLDPFIYMPLLTGVGSVGKPASCSVAISHILGNSYGDTPAPGHPAIGTLGAVLSVASSLACLHQRRAGRALRSFARAFSYDPLFLARPFFPRWLWRALREKLRTLGLLMMQRLPEVRSGKWR